MKNTLGIIFFLMLTSGLHAGWYEVYNYNGKIDAYPITLSIQIRDGYFGEKDKKDWNIIGLYKYDKFNTPIRVEGKLDKKNKKVYLYVLEGEGKTERFEFTFSEKVLTGKWINLTNGKELPLQLQLVSQLVDTTNQQAYKNVDILQESSSQDLYFIGVYQKEKESNKAFMEQLKIIRKKDNTIFQTINFTQSELIIDIPLEFIGNIMTIIYNTVSVEPDSKDIWINCDIGRIGGFLILHYNIDEKKYEIEPDSAYDGGSFRE